MGSISIKTKVILVIALCLTIGATALIGFVQKSYNDNVQLVARQSLDSARKSYQNMEQNDYRSLQVAAIALQRDQKMGELFAAGDPKAVFAYVNPMYSDLKAKYGVNLFTFVMPDKTVFLRMLTPKKRLDTLKMTVVNNAVRDQKMWVGSELGKAGYALRACAPYRDSSGKLIGYLLIGDTYDSFLSTMKTQTGDEYTMVGLKSLCDEKKYHQGQQQKHLKDTWSEFKNVIVLSATREDRAGAKFDSELKSIPTDGKLLGQTAKNGKVSIRGVFPLIDLAGKQIGGVFVEHDITPLFNGMQAVKTSAMAAIVVLMLFISVTIASILNRLVFARLQSTMDVATRMVGGDFETQIVATSDDEVGRLERLLEQFRSVFVNTIKDFEQQSDEQLRKSA